MNEDQKKKISDAKKGKPAWNKGVKMNISREGQGAGRRLSDATKERISIAKTRPKEKGMLISLQASPTFQIELNSTLTS